MASTEPRRHCFPSLGPRVTQSEDNMDQCGDCPESNVFAQGNSHLPSQVWRIGVTLCESLA